jgi:hypothetical protein
MAGRVDREGPIHASVLAYLRRQYPNAVIHHSANQTDVRGPAIARAIAKQKMMGMLVGFPDLLMLHEGRLYTFEVKAPKGVPSDPQKAVGEAIVASGGFWAVVRSTDDVREAMEKWNA